MARVAFAQRAFTDLDRITGFLDEIDPQLAAATLECVIDATRILGAHPLIGHPTRIAWRELVISQGRTGYVALYAHDPAADSVLILALRHQREADFDET